MLYVKMLVVLAVAALLDGLVPQYWPPFTYVDLPLIVTVYVALMRDPWLAMLYGCAVGIAGDVAPGSGAILGVGGFAKTVVAFVVASVGVKFPLEGPLMRVFALALASIANSIAVVGLYALFDRNVGEGRTTAEIARVVGFETAANLVAGVFIFWALDKIFPEKAASGQMRVRRRIYE